MLFNAIKSHFFRYIKYIIFYSSIFLLYMSYYKIKSITNVKYGKYSDVVRVIAIKERSFFASLFCHMGVYYTQLLPQEVRHTLL